MPADTGEMRIATVFAHAHAEGRAAVIPYLPLGYPQPERSLALAKAAIDGCNKIVFKDDSQITDLIITKRYGHSPSLIIIVDEIEGLLP